MIYQLEDISTIWMADQGKYGISVDMGALKFIELAKQHASPSEVADAFEKLATKIRSAG